MTKIKKVDKGYVARNQVATQITKIVEPVKIEPVKTPRDAKSKRSAKV